MAKEGKINIIVAIAGKKRVIGKAGGMPWYIPEELKRFKEITMGHPIIMGRRTHESIGKPLPGRTNIVITKDHDYSKEGIKVVHSLGKAIEAGKASEGGEEVFIIGGGEIYKQALPLADKLYITEIEHEMEGDVFFPDYNEFKKVVSKSEMHESNGVKYRFLELQRDL